MGTVVQLELFRVSAADPPWRDNRDAMEFPFLSLQKRRTKPIEFENAGARLSVGADSRFSIATIWDCDLVIFAASHLNDCIEAGGAPAPRVAFVPYDCLRQLLRHTGGKDYRELAAAVRRLYATTVITNIRREDGGERPFRWSDYWIPKRYERGILTPLDPDGEPDPLRLWEIELPPWLYKGHPRRASGLFPPDGRPGALALPAGAQGGSGTGRAARRSPSAWTPSAASLARRGH